MALRFYGTKDPKIVETARLRRFAPFIGVDLKVLESEMRQTAIRALDTWPNAMKNLPVPGNVKNAILSRFGELTLVREVRPTTIQGHALGTPTG
jgi:serine/threonine-protein kinase HipA